MQETKYSRLSTRLLLTALLCLGVLWFVRAVLTAKDLFSPDLPLQQWTYTLGVLGVMFLLTGLCVREVFRRRSPAPERGGAFFPVMSGLLALCLLGLMYVILGMWPFGKESAMIVDMHHQYGPMLYKLRDMLQNGGSPLYSFEIGLGTSFLPTFGYYLASPLNVLLLLFPDALLTEGILFITLVKNALSAAFFSLMLQTVYRRRSMAIPLMSVMYALMMYVIAYSWNIMWLDGLMMLPLVILGFEHLMRRGKYLPYVLSLAYTLFANYYIGFMVCVFTFLYFVAYLVRTRREAYENCVALVRFSLGSLLGGGLVMGLLLPVFFGLGHTSAVGGGFETLASNFPIFDLLGRHLYDVSPTIRSGNLPNIACGILTIVLVPLFLSTKAIPRRRRMTYAGLWLFLAMSLVINNLNLIWHGLHVPNDLPYRFSFLYSFFLLLMGYEALLHLRKIRMGQIVATVGGLAAYLILEERFGNAAYGFKTIYVSLLLVVVYGAILVLGASRTVRTRVAYALLMVVVTGELLTSSALTVKRLDSQEHYTDHEDYVDNAYTQAIREAVEKAESIGDAANGEAFYRMELLPRRTLVDTAMFGYRGITLFSSSNYYTTTRLMNSLGYAANGINSHMYKSFVAPIDSLLGINYVVLRSNLVGNPYLRQVASASAAKDDGEVITYYVYENDRALPVAFLAQPGIRNWEFSYYNPILTQNTLFSTITGDEREMYKIHPVSLAEGSSNGTVNTELSPSYFSLNGGSGTGQFEVTVETAGQVYIFVDCRAAQNISVRSGSHSWSVPAREPYIIDGGQMAAGDTVSVSISSNGACTGNILVVTLNEPVYADAVDTIRAGGLAVSSFTDSKIEGKVNASYSGVMMTSIPYDEGWQVSVDGKRVETYGIADSLLAFDLPQGEHTVVMTFVPKGWVAGLIVSGACLLALVALVLFVRRRPGEDITRETDDWPPVDESDEDDPEEEISAETPKACPAGDEQEADAADADRTDHTVNPAANPAPGPSGSNETVEMDAEKTADRPGTAAKDASDLHRAAGPDRPSVEGGEPFSEGTSNARKTAAGGTQDVLASSAPDHPDKTGMAKKPAEPTPPVSISPGEAKAGGGRIALSAGTAPAEKSVPGDVDAVGIESSSPHNADAIRPASGIPAPSAGEQMSPVPEKKRATGTATDADHRGWRIFSGPSTFAGSPDGRGWDTGKHAAGAKEAPDAPKGPTDGAAKDISGSDNAP